MYCEEAPRHVPGTSHHSSLPRTPSPPPPPPTPPASAMASRLWLFEAITVFKLQFSAGESFRLEFKSFHSTHVAPHLAFSGLDLFLNSLLKTVRLRVKPFKDYQAQSHITAGRRSACLSWCRAAPGAHDQIFRKLNDGYYCSFLICSTLPRWKMVSVHRQESH